MGTVNTDPINGLDTDAFRQMISDVEADPVQGVTRFGVRTAWVGGTRSDTHVTNWEFGGQQLPKSFVIRSDEPIELCGGNHYPNPQELLMAAFNACMVVGYVAGASMQGIELTRLEIETSGELDLRGFLGIGDGVEPGYEELQTVVRIQGNGTPEQFEEIHENVMASSPNRFNLSNPVRLTSKLMID
jgi:uncharacterized OsmC-like protein